MGGELTGQSNGIMKRSKNMRRNTLIKRPWLERAPVFAVSHFAIYLDCTFRQLSVP
jgi:hypothetical protein